jgi:hypothetical protein
MALIHGSTDVLADLQRGGAPDQLLGDAYEVGQLAEAETRAPTS